MRTLIALTVLAGATFVAAAPPAHAMNRMKDPCMSQHTHCHMQHTSHRSADDLPPATVPLPSSVAAYMRGHLAIRPIRPLTSGIVLTP